MAKNDTPERRVVEIEFVRFRKTADGLQPQPCKGVMSVPADWTDEQVKERRDQIQAEIGAACDRRDEGDPDAQGDEIDIEELRKILLPPEDTKEDP